MLPAAKITVKSGKEEGKSFLESEGEWNKGSGFLFYKEKQRV